MTESMTARERAQARANGTLPTAKPSKSPAVPDVQCVSRGVAPAGKLHCSCSNSPQVYTCGNSWVKSGYCTPQDTSGGKFPPDGKILLKDGGTIGPSDPRRKDFVAWPLRQGESPGVADVVVCATCPKRIEPPPHILRLRELGIQGRNDPDAGHCDILHLSTDENQWIAHTTDWQASTPPGMTGMFACHKSIKDLAPFVEATAPRLVIIHTTVCEPGVVAKAVQQFPSVKFWQVYHGSQLSMAVHANWMRNQKDFLALSEQQPNVWYGTPEPTAPWSQLGYQRFLTYPNTFPWGIADAPRPLHSPPVLLIAARDDVIKGCGSAVLAAALVAKVRPVRLVAIMRNNATASLASLAGAARIGLEPQPYRSPEKFRSYLRDEVDVLLNPSVTDAFQCVGMDALSQGRPVVGTSAVHYLPAEWQANPNDPADLARVALAILDGYEAASRRAADLAGAIARRQLTAYHAAVKRILES
jgi:hypothetical protein